MSVTHRLLNRDIVDNFGTRDDRPTTAFCIAPGMQNRLVITALCTAALVYACGPWVRSQSANSNAANRSNETQIAATGTVPSTVPGKVRGTVATQLDVARNGSRVDFALRVTNNTKKIVELRFANARTHDIAVLDSTGKTVWRANAGRLFTQTMQALTVKSSDTLSMNDTWDTNGAHGAYTAVALLATTTHPVERRVAFTLP